MKCPHCDKTVKVPDVAFENARHYGSNHFHFRCKCGGMYAIGIERRVVATSISKSSRTEPDWT